MRLSTARPGAGNQADAIPVHALRRSPQLRGRRLAYRWSHALTGALAGACLAGGALAVRSIWSGHAIVALSAVLLAVTGYSLGRASDRLWESSLTDPLTGLANRRYFDQRMRSILAGADRFSFPVALLLVDVDRLKAINDRLGHRAGDAALRAVGQALERSCRLSDVVARCGGDEFAVLAPFTTVSQAQELAERIREELPRRVRGRGSASLALSVSIGVSECGRNGSAGQFVEAADHALYTAKANGRGRVEVQAMARTLAMFPLSREEAGKERPWRTQQ